MATPGDGRAPYESGGAGGKFRKTPFRRSAPATPYDRPPTALKNNNPSLLTKLVDPASRLIYAGAHRLFGAFRNRVPPLSLQGPPEIHEGYQNVPEEAERNNCTQVSKFGTDQSGNSASISTATGISELEQMLKQKTFTRDEIQRLTSLLHSRTTESTSYDVFERNAAKALPNPLLRLEASTSGLSKKHEEDKDNFHAAAISTPVVSSREAASPAELAKAYMGSRPMKVAPSTLGLSSQTPRQDPKLLNNATGFPKTPITSTLPKTANRSENGFFTPRSRGRSAMYSMARTPYSRGTSTLNQKVIRSDYGNTAALTSSQSALAHEGKTALKRRNSVLDDDFGSGGPLRRTRQKANLLSRDKRELGYTSFQQGYSSQKLLLLNESEPQVTKGVEENSDTTMRGSPYDSVPTKSTQMATKILQQLERLSPKEKNSRGGVQERTPTKLTLNMLHGQALRSMEKVESPKFLPIPRESQKSEVQQHTRLNDISESTSSQSKDKVEENGLRKFPIPRNMFSKSVNGDSTVFVKDNAPVVTSNDSSSKVPVEPPQKKRAFQMSAPEDSLELDDDTCVNGHVSVPLAENSKPETSLVINKTVSVEEVQTPTLPEPSKTPPLDKVNVTPLSTEVTKIPEHPVPKEAEMATLSSKNDVAFHGSVSKQEIGFKVPTSPPLTTTTTPTNVLQKPTLQMDKLATETNSNTFSLFSTIAEKVSPLQFSAKEPNASADPKPLDSTSVFSSFTKNNDEAKIPVSNKVENGNDQKSENISAKSESLFSAVPPTTSTSFFSFGGSANTSATPDVTSVASSPIFPSFPASSGANANSLFNNGSSSFTSASIPTVVSTTTAAAATTTAASSLFSSSVAPPVFSFGSATTTPSKAETENTSAANGKEPESNSNASPFASTSFATTSTTGSSLFGFSSPAATSTTNNQSQASFFNTTTGSQANTQTVPFQFNSSTTSNTSLFGSSAPAFGSNPSFGITASSEGKSGNSTTTTTTTSTSIFGSAPSTWQQPPTSSPVFSFGASSTPTTSPSVFGASNNTIVSTFSFGSAGATNSATSVFGNSTPVFGGVTASPNNNNNDQMSMEDTMAEDSMQTPSPSANPFGQPPAAAPGFMFGSATPTPAPAPAPAAVPFQFGGQPNQTPTANPFQSSSVEFNAGGGSFSLGSGGDKSGRRIVRVKNKNRRK